MSLRKSRYPILIDIKHSRLQKIFESPCLKALGKEAAVFPLNTCENSQGNLVFLFVCFKEWSTEV